MAEYNWSGLLGSITTVVAFVAFLAIVAWAYSGRRKAAFERAANEPFALPDDNVGGGDTTAAGPCQGGRCAPSGGSAAAKAASVGAHNTGAAGPSQGARCAPSGGSAAANAASVGAQQ